MVGAIDIKPAAAQTVERTGGTAIWWQRYDEAVAYHAEHGNSDFPYTSPLYGWVQNIRRSWEGERLTAQQIQALGNLGIKRTSSCKQSGPNAGKGSFLDEATRLKGLVDGGTATSKEEEAYERALDLLRSKYDRGMLSPRTAKVFGLE